MIKNCVIAAGIKNYKSIITKKRKKHDKIILIAKYKLNSIEVLISKALIDSNVNWLNVNISNIDWISWFKSWWIRFNK